MNKKTCNKIIDLDRGRPTNWPLDFAILHFLPKSWGSSRAESIPPLSAFPQKYL